MATIAHTPSPSCARQRHFRADLLNYLRMSRTVWAGAALFVLAACGSDDHGVPGTEKYPTAEVCPGKKSLRPRAFAAEDMIGSKVADKTLALTFDNGPSPATSAIETYLSTQNIRATFFINGTNAAALTTALDQTAADGHLLANRSQTDEDITKLTPEQLVKNITDVDDLLKNRTPETKLYFRPPYGHWNEAVFKTIEASPMKKYTGPVAWDIGNNLDDTTGSDVECWDEENGTKTVEQCGDLFLKQIRDKKKGIVLMHDGGGDQTKTGEMLKYMIPILKSEGFKFARLDELKLLPRSKTFPGDDPPGPGGPTTPGDTNNGTGEVTEEGFDPCATP